MYVFLCLRFLIMLVLNVDTIVDFLANDRLTSKDGRGEYLSHDALIVDMEAELTQAVSAECHL